MARQGVLQRLFGVRCTVQSDTGTAVRQFPPQEKCNHVVTTRSAHIDDAERT